mmetsp:Transcript_30563/g.45614  ORF Transcript_30563/g.45614 Transcript_30563/m.45614 type:complete len:330 (-) Transcript_30563:111-1100(-)
MKFLLWWHDSSIHVFSTLPITEVNGISLNITNSNHGRSQSSTDLHENLWVLVVGHSLHNGSSTGLWVGRLKDSTSNEHSIHTKLHHKCGIRRCGNSTSGKVHHRKSSIIRNELDKFIRGPKLLGGNEEFILGHDRKSLNFRLNSSCMTDRLDNVSSPSLSLGTKHGRSLRTPTKCLSNVTTSTNKGNIEHILINMIDLICHGEHLTLINIINFTCLKNLCFDKVPDTSLGHDGDGDGVFDFEDHVGVGHAGDSSVATDIGGDAFEGHDGDCSGCFGDLGLFDVHDIHNNTTLEHLRQSLLHLIGTNLGSISVSVCSSHLVIFVVVIIVM